MPMHAAKPQSHIAHTARHTHTHTHLRKCTFVSGMFRIRTSFAATATILPSSLFSPAPPKLGLVRQIFALLKKHSSCPM